MIIYGCDGLSLAKIGGQGTVRRRPRKYQGKRSQNSAGFDDYRITTFANLFGGEDGIGFRNLDGLAIRSLFFRVPGGFSASENSRLSHRKLILSPEHLPRLA